MKKMSLLLLSAFTTTSLIKPATQAAVAPAKSSEAKPAVAAVTDAASSLSLLTQSQLPLFSPDGKDKITQYKQYIVLLNPTTARDVIQRGVELFTKDVTTRALAMTELSLKQLEDIVTITELYKGTMSSLDTRLATSTDTGLKQFIKLALAEFTSSLKALRAKIDEQKKFRKDLELGLAKAQNNPEKIMAELERAAAFVTPSLTASSRDRYIRAIEEVAPAIAEKKGKLQERFKSFITKLQQNGAFTVSEKQRFIQALNPSKVEKAVQIDQPLATGSAAPSATFVAKLKELETKKTVQEKLSFLKDVLMLITASSSQQEKNQLIALCNNFFMAYPAYTSAQLDVLRAFLIEVIGHPFFLNDAQKKIVSVWLKNTTQALPLSDEKISLIENVKKKIELVKTDFDAGCQAIFFGMYLLDARIPAQEKNAKDKKSLVTALRNALPVIYTLRANRTVEALGRINQIINAASARAELKDVIGKGWTQSLAVLTATHGFSANGKTLEKIKGIQHLVDLIKENMPRYEITKIIDMLSTIISSRVDYAAIEIDRLLEIVNKLLGQDLAKLKIFNTKDLQRFQEWKALLEITVNMHKLAFAPTFDQKIEQGKRVLSSLDKQGYDAERKMFVRFLRILFLQRATLKKDDLIKLKEFFVAVKTTKNVLTPDQINVLNSWIADLDLGVTLATSTQNYLEVLVQQTHDKKDLALALRAVQMLDQTSPKTLVSQFIKALNTFVTGRNAATLDNVVVLLAAVESKAAALLSAEQQAVLKQWLNAPDIKARLPQTLKKAAAKK